MEVKLRQLCNDIRRKPTPLADAIPTMQAAATEIERLRAALENVRLLAARHRTEEWAGHMLRFCADAGVTGSPLREGGK